MLTEHVPLVERPHLEGQFGARHQGLSDEFPAVHCSVEGGG